MWGGGGLWGGELGVPKDTDAVDPRDAEVVDELHDVVPLGVRGVRIANLGGHWGGFGGLGRGWGADGGTGGDVRGDMGILR